jgi:hypothetical protein
MKQFILICFLIAAATARVQGSPDHVPTCNKLPYRLGKTTITHSTDLRSEPRRATKKELNEMRQKQSELQGKFNAFVRKNPGRLVSTDFSYEVKGFAAYLVRCESFCGTEEDLLQANQKEIDGTAAPNK